MAIGRMVHWIGVAFVSIAAILLVVTSVGAPAVPDIGLLKVFLKNASDIRESSVVYGPFGYCVLDVAPAQTDQDYCSHASIGYVPAQEMRLLNPATTWTTWKGHDLDQMTVSYILFPIASFIAFCAAGFAFCGVIGSMIASVLCATALVVTFPVMVLAFVSMGYLKSHVQAAGLKAQYGIGMWTCLAAFILLFFAMLFLFFSCCSGLRRKPKDKKRYDEKHSKHRESSERSLNHTRSNDHHYGRDAAIGTAGVGALAAERHHHNRDISGHGLRHPPANDAAARAEEGVAGVDGYNNDRHTTHGNNYDSVLASQDRQNLTPNHGSSSHHYGRDATLAGGSAGAGVLAAHEYERSRPTPMGAGVAVPAPREHKLRGTLRDSSHRGYEEPIGSGGNSQYAGRAVAPVHHSTTLGGNSTTHHPTTTTSTSTYADERGVYNTGLETRTHV